MAHPQIAVFARMADGGAKPVRAIEGQTTLLGRTMHAIDYDPIHDEIVAPQQFGQSILIFDAGANGEEPPIRVIQGSRTGLRAPDRLAVDPVNNEIYVPEGEIILVFPREANGNVAPIRTLRPPPGEELGGAVAVDPVNDVIAVVSRDAIKIYDRTASGVVRPKRVIEGPATGVNSTRNVRIYNGWILVANDDRQGQLGESDRKDDVARPLNSYVAIFRLSDEGNVPPTFTLGGPDGTLQKPRGIDMDPENKVVIVSDKYLNAVISYSIPEIFDTNGVR